MDEPSMTQLLPLIKRSGEGLGRRAYRSGARSDLAVRFDHEPLILISDIPGKCDSRSVASRVPARKIIDVSSPV